MITALPTRRRPTWPDTAIAAGRTLPTPAQRHEVASEPAAVGASLALPDVVSTAVELNRGRAARRELRLHAYVVDEAVPLAAQPELLERFDRLIGRAILNAQWGSAISVGCRLADDGILFHICYARPAPLSAPAGAEIDWIDELWSWSLDEVPATRH